MEDIALLATLVSMHKLIETLSNSPSTTTLVIISSISGILGVVIGFLIQEIKNHLGNKEEIKKSIELINFELNRIIENATLVIEVSSYMLDNNIKIDRNEITIPTPCMRVFYDKFIPNIAVKLERNRLEAMVNAYDYALEMDSCTSHLDVITSADNNKRLYNYEYVMHLAVCAYQHANNALAEVPIKWDEVEISHEIVSSKLGHKCNYLGLHSKIKR